MITSNLAILEHGLDCLTIQLGATPCPQFFLNVFAMGINGMGTQEESVGDGARAYPSTDQPKNFQLAIGQHVEWVIHHRLFSKSLGH